ncbi:MAG: hypothetical protein IPH42_20100 [Bacteroidetes bacterium]|nr:hypothetical protein [Bacteroidota bacterium]
MEFENKSIFISAGLSGIGKACAIDAAKEGTNIAIAHISALLNKAGISENSEVKQTIIDLHPRKGSYSLIEKK